MNAMGHYGESIATCLLEANNNYTVLKKNFKSPHGEVDIIGTDLRTDSLVFFEVKTWMVFSVHELQRSITIGKQKKIIKTAEYFLAEHTLENFSDIRFDVIFIRPSPFRFLHIESAFIDGQNSEKY